MMASRKVDLRLVKRKREAKTSIDSPLARYYFWNLQSLEARLSLGQRFAIRSLSFSRYNSAGQLSCVVCDMTVKNEFLWTSHVLGKKHKEVN